MDSSFGTMGMDMGNDTDMGGMTMVMAMSFEFTKKSTVLFKSWHFNSVGGLVGSMVGIFIMAFAYEALKFFRDHLRRKSFSIRQNNKGSGNNMDSKMSILSKSHFIQTALHAIQVIMSYFLMLIFMTYNAWLCIAVVWGLVTGYFIFGWNTSAAQNANDNDDHCS